MKSKPDPSKPLKDRKRERFCQELVAGAKLYEAHATAGFRRARGNAQRMEREPDVVARVEFLRGKTEEFEGPLLALRRIMVREKIDNIATEDRLGLFEEYEAKGTRRLRLKALDQLTPAQRALVEGVETTEAGVVKVTMPSKLAAFAQLTKLDGLDKPTKIAPTSPDGNEPALPSVIVEIVKFSAAGQDANGEESEKRQ